MRTIKISTEVFAKIWSCREDDEEYEDDILRRILGCSKSKTEVDDEYEVGYRDPRFNVFFPKGIEIFRNYKGVEYRAEATHGQWLLKNTGELLSSLNQLTNAVSDGNENAWVSWKFVTRTGEVKKISYLREFQEELQGIKMKVSVE